ncbi:MAG: penicillin-binding protein 2 [Actinobacteria bacterium]|nr:penicillin-binding protein 2 [Actinomycetota bacterium]
MQASIRRLGIFFIILAVVMVINLSYLQVWGQKKLIENPANTRRLIEEYGISRGRIITADGLVVAESVETEGPFEYRRSYPGGSLLCHVIGYDSPQFGRSGLEAYYNEYLLGRKPSRGWVEEMTSDPEQGNDLTITIDSEVQAAAAQALGERKGAVMAIDPKTGAVLAMYSWPVFDPNALMSQERDAAGDLAADAVVLSYTQDPSSPLLNRASLGLFTPGSSFKIVTASAGIESGFPPDTVYNCPGVLPVGNFRVTNYGDPPRDFGTQNMDQALTASVNTYFAQLALAMGGDALVDCAERFGMNGVPPLDYPAVAASSIPQVGEMDDVELAWTGAGQGELLMTPLQLCLAGCAIANGGKTMLPHLMKDVRLQDSILERFDAGEWRTPIAAETAEQVLEMMVHVVESGTGTAAAIPGVSVAGKTGTAEVEGMPNHAWFIGIAPAENPTVVVAVVVENSGGGGGSVAAPIAREVLEAALK